MFMINNHTYCFSVLFFGSELAIALNFNLIFGTIKNALLHPLIITHLILMIVRASTGLKQTLKAVCRIFGLS